MENVNVFDSKERTLGNFIVLVTTDEGSLWHDFRRKETAKECAEVYLEAGCKATVVEVSETPIENKEDVKA